jgi:rod shape-determining protein MreD
MKIKVLPIVLSIIVAMMLTILPIPHGLALFRPPWVLLMILYWLSVSKSNQGIIYIWLAGIGLDLITVATLGEHALALLIACFALQNYTLRLRFYPMWQQCIIIGAYALIYQLSISLVQISLSDRTGVYFFWAPALTSMFFWPWISLLLNSQTRRYRAHA